MGKTTRVREGDPGVGIGYLRCSTLRQDLSPAAQRASIEQWGKANHVRIVAWFFDKGVSGGAEIEDRPELVAAIAATRSNRAGCFVVAKRDRLARDTLVAQLIERAVRQAGASVVSADGVANGADAGSQMLRSVLDAVAQYERRVISSRIRAALAVKAAKGERVGKIPFGWSLAADGRHLLVDESEQQVAELAKALRDQGLTYRSIARELAHRGHHSRTGRVFFAQQVRRMVAQPSRFENTI